MRRQLTLIEIGDNMYTVHVGEDFANELTIDEAMGAVASWLFRERAMFAVSPDVALDRMMRWRAHRGPAQPDPPLQLEHK